MRTRSQIEMGLELEIEQKPDKEEEICLKTICEILLDIRDLSFNIMEGQGAMSQGLNDLCPRR
jgi:hypothetical protein